MKQQLAIILINGCIYAAFGWWTTSSVQGRRLKRFLQTWKADGWLHGILCSVTVFLAFCCGILGLALGLEWVLNG